MTRRRSSGARSGRPAAALDWGRFKRHFWGVLVRHRHLAYKKVRDDYRSYHDGETDNQVGTTVFLPREDCDPDRFRTCSSGLHFCSWSYLPNYNGSQGRVLVLKINPADVVAFPSDHQAKGRACRYTIVDEVPEEEAEHAFPKPVYATVYDDWDDDTPTVGILGRIAAWFKRRLN